MSVYYGYERRDISGGDGDKMADISVDDGRCGSRSQENSHYFY